MAAEGRITVHRVPASRWWMLAGLALAFAVSFRQITQPDYNTHRRATPDEWLWVVVPGLCAVAFVAWRVLRSRVETSPTGLRIVRAFSIDEVPWASVARFEVRPTPNRAGFVMSVRHVNQRLTRLGTIPGRSAKRRAQADAFVAALEADRPTFLAA